ncbi:MAG: polymer-forming cytoskeletal protein [Bacteroidales bacterium]|nr:polymer-forming cytoskeletal protein [Lachnoclostridium sp.]MCM1383315.1 polymer-forming cytoskeletal protein [Lachnoclostridium sp.]MCM1464979.1 polymer-forming cytoskeletal protein [Bacteroidales bacterium]
MGFFGELKEDLSQAVSELMPEEEQGAVSLNDGTENANEVKTPEETAKNAEKETTENGLTPEDTLDLDSMLEDVLKEESAMPEDQTAASVSEAEKPAEEKTAEKEVTAEQPKSEEKEERKGEKKFMEAHVGKMVSEETSVITAGTNITGDLTSEGSIDIMGSVNGNIEAWGKLNITGHVNGNSKAAEIYAESAKINGEIVSDGAVKIGASTVIIGNITAASAAIAGAVKGDIDVRGPVVLDTSAIVMGNIKSKSVQINNGAVIEGMCSQCYADVSPTTFFDEYKPETTGKKKSSSK